MYEYSAALTAIHDGDTVTLDVDLGFGIHSFHILRLSGVNAPELRTFEGKTARTWVEGWCRVNPGPYVLRTSKSRETEKYGRYLGVLTSTATGRTINDDIVAAGQAVTYNP